MSDGLHAPERRLDLAFAALSAGPRDPFLHCLAGEGGPIELPPMLAQRLPSARWIPADTHALTYVDPSDHLQVHQAWLEACHGPDRVARTTVRTIQPLVPVDGTTPGAVGRYEVTLVDLVGVDGIDAVVVTLVALDRDRRAIPPAPPPRGTASFRLELSLDGEVLAGTQSVGALLGVPLAALVGESFGPWINPDDLDLCRAAWEDVLAKPEQSQTVRVRLRHGDGTWRWFSSTAWNALADPDTEAILSEFHDIGALIEAEQALHASELGFRTLAESLPVGVAVLDQDGQVQFANHHLVTILTSTRLAGPESTMPGGPPTAPAYTTSWDDLVAPELAEVVANLLRPGDPDAPPVSTQIELAGPDGSLVTLLVQVVTIWNQDGRNVIVSVLDVSPEVEALRAHERELAELARRDPLTGLPNRLALMEALEACSREGDPADEVAVHFIDLDNLKVVNDGLGHSAGDRLLEAVAHELAAEAAPAVVGRFGGDEFVVISAPAPADPLAQAERMLAAVNRATVAGVATHVSASLGVATASRGGLLAEDLLRDADAAMYEAKHLGKSRCVRFDEALRERASRRFLLERALRTALEHERLEVHLQPIVTTADGLMTGVEALCRWEGVSPAEFIPIAEESGLIVPLGEQVMARALAAASRLRAASPAWSDLRIGVNASARELAVAGFHERTLAAIEASGVAPEHVVLELTESVLIDPNDEVDRALHALRDAGVGLALDDFGSGYSSLTYLRRYPIDVLKLDISYTQAMVHDAETRVIVEALVSMASRLGIRVVAEGVETQEQLTVATELGVTWCQGYLLGRPQPLDALMSQTPASGESSGPSPAPFEPGQASP